MKIFPIAFLIVFASCTHTYYVVRHAEKEQTTAAMMSNDVPLSKEGRDRAERLLVIMSYNKIRAVYATNTLRARQTVQPTADHFHLKIQLYGPIPDSSFFEKIRSLKKNALIVGHSNTVDDIVNGICGRKEVDGDLKDDEYNHMYIIKRKGKKITFESGRIHFSYENPVF